MAARKNTAISADRSSDAVEQVLRLFTILHLVTSRRPNQRIGRPQLARACECDVRTVARAIKVLQEAQIPIDYDPVARTYTLPDKGWALTTSALSASDVLALTLACALQADETTPFSVQTRAALEKITVGMPAALRLLLEQTTQALQTSGGMARDYSQAPVRPLLAASAQRQTVEMLYDSRNSGLCERRLVDPYLVEIRDGRYWEMQAWCHRDERVKTFALDRVLDVRTPGERFAVRPWVGAFEKRVFKSTFQMILQRFSNGPLKSPVWLCQKGGVSGAESSLCLCNTVLETIGTANCQRA